MIKKSISRALNVKEHSMQSVQEEMRIEAIKDDGIYSTFKFHNKWLSTVLITKTTLYYCKFDGDGCSWIPVQKTIFYINCPELGNITLPSICPETLRKVIDRIKLDLAKKYNAIWSTIKVEPCHGHFDVSYEKVYVDNDKDKVYVDYSAFDPYVENTKKTLRRIQENSYYGLYPRRFGLTTYAFDEKAKEDLKDSLKTWKTKAEACDSAAKCLGFVDAENLRRISEEFRSYGSHNKEEKEKKDMNVTLLVVPEGMSKEFVNKIKADFQANTSRLFVASTDIDYSCEHEPIKTKYDLFENWIKTGKVDVVYFMLGFEKDPDVRAFESFVRGITEAEVPGKIDIRVAYQVNDIVGDMNSLRTRYFDEADAKEDLENATNKVIKEAERMRDVYGLDDEGLEDIKNSTGRIDASEKLVMGKIMEMAFAEDENTKPVKKGGKK